MLLAIPRDLAMLPSMLHGPALRTPTSSEALGSRSCLKDCIP